MHAVRTNNDVEGYHHAVNRRAGKTQIGFYLLIQVLYEESRLTKLNIRLVNEGKLCRYQRKKVQEGTRHFVHLVERVVCAGHNPASTAETLCAFNATYAVNVTCTHGSLH